MSSQRLREENITIVTEDGRQLSARWWLGTKASEHSIVFLSGLAAPQIYLRSFAAYLATQGWGVLTFDYRGIGASKDAQLDSFVTADDWVNLDIPAAVAEVKRRTATKFLGVVAHSIGGQLFGQSPVRQSIDGALFISAQRGIPKLFQGKARLRIHYAYTLFPIFIRIFGHLPISKLTLPQQCPNQVLLQWMSWGRSGILTDATGVNIESLFAEYSRPLTTVTISDDNYYASAASVEALTRLYQGSKVRHEVISPRDYGMESMGHFGFFHRRASQKLWSQAADWLTQLVLEADSSKSQSI
ncbi:alpha/beta fold hydrolase [Nostoc commune]|uniref:alpha/beta hydrolase family protein n=1 Tax=Nostoc commune TaxID=1178 RepID=UPI0018C75443|nr:alpha/beta fold hydrolase [Nostoc commune]MBG1261237.1 alpha/beta fold hydrolase [Nostoc commune BAE]